jgi:hypothetical protein
MGISLPLFVVKEAAFGNLGIIFALFIKPISIKPEQFPVSCGQRLVIYENRTISNLRFSLQ